MANHRSPEKPEPEFCKRCECWKLPSQMDTVELVFGRFYWCESCITDVDNELEHVELVRV